MNETFLCLAILVIVHCDKISSRNVGKYGKLSISMPNSKPTEPDTYLCTPLELANVSKEPMFVKGFEVRAEAKIAHHILLLGCKEPGSRKPVYNCGEMERQQRALKESYRTCKSGMTIVYAWAKNAPELKLPKNVAFEIGGPNSDVRWLVLQVHYASVKYVPPDGDTSAVNLFYTKESQPKQAGVFLMWTRGSIPAHSVTEMDVTCPMEEKNKVIHPFAFRVHTHELGQVVSGWKVNKKLEWSLIGKADPQIPQMFFPVKNDTIAVKAGEFMGKKYLCKSCEFSNPPGSI